MFCCSKRNTWWTCFLSFNNPQVCKSHPQNGHYHHSSVFHTGIKTSQQTVWTLLVRPLESSVPNIRKFYNLKPFTCFVYMNFVTQSQAYTTSKVKNCGYSSSLAGQRHKSYCPQDSCWNQVGSSLNAPTEWLWFTVIVTVQQRTAPLFLSKDITPTTIQAYNTKLPKQGNKLHSVIL